MEIVVDNVYISILPLAIIILVILLTFLWFKKRSLSYLVCLLIFSVYILMAVNIVFFPINMSSYYADEMRKIEDISSFFNFIPFNFNLSEMPELVFRQIVQNILLTVPLGFGVNFVVHIPAKRILWLALAVGLGTEFVQLIISLLLRYPYRVIDINDVLLNALGVLIGYGIFRVFAWLYEWALHRFKIKPWGPAGYIYQVATHTQATTNSLT